MKKTHILLLGLWTLLLPLGCGREPLVPDPEEDVSVSLALSVGAFSKSGATKMAESVTQHSMSPSSFRGIDRVYILPFRTGYANAYVGEGASLWDYRVSLPQLGLDGSFMNQAESNAGLINNNYAHLYNPVYLRPDTDAVLVYGKAMDESVGSFSSTSVTYLQHNGSLVAPDFDKVENTDEIVFDPDPISSNVSTSSKYGAVQWRSNIIDNYLNKILTTSVSSNGTPKKTSTFNDPTTYENHPALSAALEAFTNKGLYFPLSKDFLDIKLTQLYQALYPYATDDSRSADYYYVPKNGAAFPYVYELAKAVVKKIYDDTKTNEQNTYASRYYESGQYKIRLKINGPAVYGLPSGTIPIQWQEKNKTFRVLYNIDPLSGLGYIPSDEICYPPSLWYYVNSPLVSTDQENVTQKYTSQYTWEAISSSYTASGVGSQSKAAAVRDPVQYGVALLELTCQKVGSNRIDDFENTGNSGIDIKNQKFPLTGILIADQYQQCFDFTPTLDENAKMWYVFDADVNDSNGNAQAWISSSATSATLTTLVLPTRPEADVRFALEFLNKTNYTTVVGANGCQIAPGCHFYLAGVLKFANRVNNSEENLGSIFVRGHKTEVRATFTSFQAAYDVVPDLKDPQLQLGVSAEFGWDLSTPTNVPIVIQ